MKYKYHRPDCVRDITEEPLYVAVAYWGLRTNQLVTIESIIRDFHVTIKKATDVLSYIENDGSLFISFERGKCKIPGCFSEMTSGLRILDINESALRKFSRQKKRVRNDKLSPNIRALRRWMVSRKNVEPVPQALLEEY